MPREVCIEEIVRVSAWGSLHGWKCGAQCVFVRLQASQRLGSLQGGGALTGQAASLSSFRGARPDSGCTATRSPPPPTPQPSVPRRLRDAQIGTPRQNPAHTWSGRGRARVGGVEEGGGNRTSPVSLVLCSQWLARAVSQAVRLLARTRRGGMPKNALWVRARAPHSRGSSP